MRAGVEVYHFFTCVTRGVHVTVKLYNIPFLPPTGSVNMIDSFYVYSMTKTMFSSIGFQLLSMLYAVSGS